MVSCAPKGGFSVQMNGFACVQRDGSLFSGKVLYVFRGKVFMCSFPQIDVHEYRRSVPVQRMMYMSTEGVFLFKGKVYLHVY